MWATDASYFKIVNCWKVDGGKCKTPELGDRAVSDAHLFWGLMAMIALLVFVGAGLFSLMWLMG